MAKSPADRPGPADSGAAVTGWIRDHAWPMGSLDPSAPLHDLAPLGDVFGPAAVVGLGESVRGVRGSHELYLVKHRLLRLAVEALGFRVLAVEEDDAAYRMAGGSLAGWFDVIAFVRGITPVHHLAP